MRKLAVAAFSFGAAIFVSHFILPYDLLLVSSVVAAAFAAAGFFLTGHKRVRFVIAVLSISTAFLWSWSYTTFFVKPYWELHDEIITTEATVTDYPVERQPRGYHVDVSIRQGGLPVTGVRLYYFDEAELSPGDIIEITARFRRTDTTDEGERFDALSSKGVFLSAYISGGINTIGADSGFRYIPKNIAERISVKIDEVYPGDISHFLKALLTGKRDELYKDSSLNASLSASGIVHIVSISGMHISFLMGFLALIIKNKRLFAFYGIPSLLFFMAMTGFTPAVTRAGTMQIFLICAPLFKRESDSVTSLGSALIFLLAANPYSCASVGLQLSFAATLGIILITTSINSAITDSLHGKKALKKKIPRVVINYSSSSISTTIGALIFTLPLTAIHFGYVSLIAPLTNLMTLAVVSLAFPVGLAAALLAFIHPLIGIIVAWPVTIGARYIIFIARSLATVPYSVVYSSNMHIMFWLAYIYIIFISLPVLKARARQYLYPACIAIILLFTIILISHFIPSSNQHAVTVLDVGQGMSVAVTSNEHTMIVDCGSNSLNNAGEIAHEFLMNQGKTSVDLLVITHFHADHVNGVEFLLSRISVSALALPDPEGSFIAEDIIELARKRGTDIIYVTETLSVSLGDTKVFLYPPLGGCDENEHGLSVLTLGDVTALITGDMNASNERSLLRFADLPKLDLLVVGHHGSRHSTSEELLGALAPDTAVIPVGRNSFGHPSPETIERIEQSGAAIYRTDESGHVTVGGG